MNVAIAPAFSVSTSRTTASRSSGSCDSRNAPPETGGISATSSPSDELALGLGVLTVDRVEQARRLLAEVERGPDVGHPPDAFEPRCDQPARSRSPAKSRTVTRTPPRTECS